MGTNALRMSKSSIVVVRSKTSDAGERRERDGRQDGMSSQAEKEVEAEVSEK